MVTQRDDEEKQLGDDEEEQEGDDEEDEAPFFLPSLSIALSDVFQIGRSVKKTPKTRCLVTCGSMRPTLPYWP